MTSVRRGLTREVSAVSRQAESTANRAPVPFSRNMGLGTFVRAVARQAGKHHLAAYAGNVAYRSLFALFPGLVSLFWLLKLFGATRAVNGLIDLATTALPHAASGTVKQQLGSISGGPASGALTIGALGVVLLTLFAVSEAFAATMEALNAMYGVEEGRPFFKRRCIAVALSLAVSALLVGTIVLLVFGSGIADRLSRVGGGQVWHWLWLVGSWPVLLLVVLAAFALVYYFAPDVEQRFCWITPGTVAGVLLWMLFAALFSVYINNFASPGEAYGALAGVAVLMAYVFGASYILLIGAEINQVLEMRQVDGKRDGEKRPQQPGPGLSATR